MPPLDKKLDQLQHQNIKKYILVLLGILFIIVTAIVSYSILILKKNSEPPREVQISHQSVAPSSESLQTGQADVHREKFKQLLFKYENELEQNLQAYSPETSEQLFTIEQLKKSGLSLYSIGDYEGAVKKLSEVIEQSSLLIKQSTLYFETEITSARSFLANKQYEQARFHIDNALAVMPAHSEARSLSQQIEKLPELLNLERQAETARVENDLERELAIQQQIKRLAPEDSDVLARIDQLTIAIKNSKYASHIINGSMALEENDLKQAWYHYKQARAIYQDRNDLPLLAKNIQRKEKQIRLQNLLQKAEQAIRRDDWELALQNYELAAKDAPNNKVIIEGSLLASQIIQAKNTIAACLENPYRLSSASVNNRCSLALEQGTTLKKSSFKLQQQVAELDNTLYLIKRKVSVHVTSDQMTYIKVRGVGHVGKVATKTIKLKPGDYTFEGSRTGFVSKLVSVRIPYDKPEFTITLICDQPI